MRCKQSNSMSEISGVIAPGRAIGVMMQGNNLLNKKNQSRRRVNVTSIALAVSTMLVTLFSALPVKAEVLQGNVSKEDTITRLSRPNFNAGANINDAPPAAPPRLQRNPNLQASTPLVDTSAFKPLMGQAQQDTTRLGAVKPDDFNLPRGFDLGTERNSRELTLAWEKWHKQLSQVIYERWSAVADEPGRATVRVTVDRNRTIQVAFINSDGSPRFDRKLRQVIEDLQGNPGLTFPTKSQRPMVSFEADYIAAHNVTPGYSWVKNDYEKIHEGY